MSTNIIKKNYFTKNRIDLRKSKSDKKNFLKIFDKIINDIENEKNIFHLFNKNYKFGFKFANLKKFKKFKNIVLIGMGGSILGTEAIFNFLKQK